ncbi:hypothetical protein K449DRAFT_387171 [Hypoxylon sp. EC38]|nr:hypothetical protein K449DRAFT_387171 [Hypoxylon sp. EC38]
MEEDQTAPLFHNLNDPSMVGTLHRDPITSPTGTSTVSCYFRSISLRPLGIRFRDLSQYGEVIEESPEKLVIRLRHRNPALLMMVVWRAWVTKYLEDGTLCTMQFEPLIPYQPVEMTIQNIDQARLTGQMSFTQGSRRESTSSANTSIATTDSHRSTESANTVYTATEEGNAAPMGPGQQLIPQHPSAEYDYYAEIGAQFAQLWSQFPTAFQMAAASNQGSPAASPDQGVATTQGVQGVEGQQDDRSQQSRGGHQGTGGQRGSQTSRGRGGRGRGRGRNRRRRGRGGDQLGGGGNETEANP